MVLFVLAYDVVIRYISGKLDIFDDNIFAYCDDLALASHNIVSLWANLQPLFQVIARCTLLEINKEKTQFCCTNGGDIGPVTQSLLDLGIDIDVELVQCYLKYLGFFYRNGL